MGPFWGAKFRKKVLAALSVCLARAFAVVDLIPGAMLNRLSRAAAAGADGAIGVDHGLVLVTIPLGKVVAWKVSAVTGGSANL